MNALVQLEDKIVELWRQRENVKRESDAALERRAEVAAQKAAAAPERAELYAAEAEAFLVFEAAVEDVADAVDGLGTIQNALRGAYGRPRQPVNRDFLRALDAELARMRARRRRKAGRDRDASRKARAADLRQLRAIQKDLGRRAHDGGQLEGRIALTEAAIRDLEGPQAPGLERPPLRVEPEPGLTARDILRFGRTKNKAA